jgi:hypothetical protein
MPSHIGETRTIIIETSLEEGESGREGGREG